MRSSRALLACVVFGTLLAACSSSRETTNTKRSWTEQLLVSSSVDRALDKVSWPRLQDRAVFVEAISTAAEADQAYLRSAVATHLALRGAAIVAERSEADLVATVLSGAIGTQETTTLIGIPETQSVVFPVPFPEVAFYKSSTQDAFAKAEIVVREAESGRVVFYQRPKDGRASSTEHQLFLLSVERTDAEDAEAARDRAREIHEAHAESDRPSDDRLWWSAGDAASSRRQPAAR